LFPSVFIGVHPWFNSGVPAKDKGDKSVPTTAGGGKVWLSKNGAVTNIPPRAARRTLSA